MARPLVLGRVMGRGMASLKSLSRQTTFLVIAVLGVGCGVGYFDFIVRFRGLRFNGFVGRLALLDCGIRSLFRLSFGSFLIFLLVVQLDFVGAADEQHVAEALGFAERFGLPFPHVFADEANHREVGVLRAFANQSF